ncbi:MAG: hypothetical protein IT450_03800 [Phycisphaerales bacterium]|nr:hypothetical protein [Phycisphaerales bacterium]
MMVFHIRTGDAGSARVVDQWIAQHALDARVTDDPYRACALLVTSPQSVPELVFLGLDRLHADELRILTYLHETWPGSPIVAYGQCPGGTVPAAAAIQCADAPAVRSVLAAGGLREVIRTATGRASEPPAREPVRSLKPDDVARPANVDLPRPRGGSADRSNAGGPSGAGGLSAREIAALLGGGAG